MPVILHHGPATPQFPFDERVRRSRMDGCLVIVPTKRRIRHLTREIMRLSPGAVAPALALHTLESFCRAMYAASVEPRHVVSGPERTLLFQSAVNSVAVALRYFRVRGGQVHLPRGTFDRLMDVIIKLKESGIYPPALEDELATEGAEEQPKLADVVSVYGAYEKRLGKLGFEDLEGIYRVLAAGYSQQQFSVAFRRLFPDVETVSLAGFDEFSVPEVGTIRRLCAVPGIAVTMMFDYRKGNDGLFGHLEENYRRFIELGFRETGEAAVSSAFFFGMTSKPDPASRAADHLARSLFLREGSTAPADLSGSVTLMAARSRVHEVETICTLIKRLVAERPDRDLSRICVALHMPQRYTDIMREQFARYEIPANITDRFELARSPLVTAVLGLLAVVLRGFRREDVLRVAGSPYLRIPSGAIPFDAGNLAAVAARVRATAGLTAWRERIDRAIGWNERIRATANDQGEARRAAGEIGALRKAWEDFASLESVLRPLHEPMTPAEFEQKVLSLLGVLSVRQRLVDPVILAHQDLAEKDIRAFTAFCDTLRELTTVAEMQENSRERSPLRVHLERLRAAVGRERYNVREQFGRGVLVTSIEETRELPVDVMIVAGLVDGDFPTVYEPEIFLSARRRKRREQRHAWENRYLFYQAVTNWTEHLYLSYPARDGELETVRSSFIDAFLKSASVRVWDRPELIPFGDDIAAREDFLRWYGSAVSQQESPIPSVPAGFQDDCAVVVVAAGVEQSRTVTHQRGEYEGRILAALPEDGQRYLDELRGRVFSASQLETYAACPYRYFAQNLLRLRGADEYEEEFTAAERGSILHETLYQFFRDRRDRALPPLQDLSPDAFEEAVVEAHTIAEAKLNALDIPDVFWEIEKELVLGREGDVGILRRFLEFERSRKEPMRPAFFEVGFGGAPGGGSEPDPELSRAEPVQLGTALLRGKVDRVDIGDGIFTVIDYKTGSRDITLNHLRQGLSLQLPLYLHAIEELLRARGGPALIPAGGFIYKIRDDIELRPVVAAEEFRGRAFPETARHKQFVPDEKALRELMDDARRAAERNVAGMARGEFPLTRPELVAEVCRHCEFRTMCRIQTLKDISPSNPEDV